MARSRAPNKCWPTMLERLASLATQGRGGDETSSVFIYVKAMHEVPRLIPTIREIFTNGAFKILGSLSNYDGNANEKSRRKLTSIS